MSDKEIKETKLEKKLREIQDRHKQYCVYEMSKAVGDPMTEHLDWPRIARAAYHAGAAKACQEALF